MSKFECCIQQAVDMMLHTVVSLAAGDWFDIWPLAKRQCAPIDRYDRQICGISLSIRLSPSCCTSPSLLSRFLPHRLPTYSRTLIFVATLLPWLNQHMLLLLHVSNFRILMLYLTSLPCKSHSPSSYFSFGTATMFRYQRRLMYHVLYYMRNTAPIFFPHSTNKTSSILLLPSSSSISSRCHTYSGQHGWTSLITTSALRDHFFLVIDIVVVLMAWKKGYKSASDDDGPSGSATTYPRRYGT